MMSDLHYYLTEDHSARQRTILLSVGIGAAAGIVADVWATSSLITALVCVVVTGGIHITRALTYVAGHQEKGLVTREFSLARRYLIRLPIAAASFLIFDLMQVPVEAAVSERLRKITTGNPPFDKADKLIDSAIHNGISIDPSSIDPVTHKVAQALIASSTPTAREAAASTLAGLEAYKAFSLAFREGEENLIMRNMSLAGPEGIPLDQHFFWGISGTKERKEKVIVYNVQMKNLYQDLDWIKWIRVTFEDSAIIWGGEEIYLSEITFKNCRFQFLPVTIDPGLDALAERLLQRLRSANNGPPLSVVIAKDYSSL
jgi:hypothetical protein